MKRDTDFFTGGSMVITAVYFLMIGHPGLVFKDTTTGCSSLHGNGEKGAIDGKT